MTRRRHVIAVLENDAVIRRAVASLLAAHGYATELYASAEDYLGVATSAAPCLVVDIRLGDISGIELGRHLAATGYKFPIIFITASDDQTLRNQAIELGCVAFLLKSMLGDRLIEAVAKAIAQTSGGIR